MEEVKTVLDETVGEPEIDSDGDPEENYTDDIDPDGDGEAENDEDIKFEYDDDGNIIIDDADEHEDTTSQEAEADPAPEEGTPAPVEPEPSPAEKELALLRGKTEAALRRLGFKGNILDALDQLGAEAAGTSVEEYRQTVAKEQEQKQVDFEQKMAAIAEKKKNDLAAIKEAYPLLAYDSIDNLPHSEDFKRKRDAGYTPLDAFRSTHSEEVAAYIASAVRQSARNGKEHLKSNVPGGARDTSISVSKAEMEAYRAIFPDLSDKEILALRRKTQKSK